LLTQQQCPYTQQVTDTSIYTHNGISNETKREWGSGFAPKPRSPNKGGH